jgi:3-oxoacyl-[acyl-carrier-protein] synthase III
MKKNPHAHLLSSAIAVPANKLTTEELITELTPLISDELKESLYSLGAVSRYTAIEDFHKFLTGKKERKLTDTTTSMATRAVKECLEKAPYSVNQEIGLLIAITNSANRPLPCLAFEIINELGTLIPHDLNVVNMQNQGCASLLKAIDLAESYLFANPDKKVLLVASETHTGYFDKLPPKLHLGFQELKNQKKGDDEVQETLNVISTILFGDGAVSLLLENKSGQRPVFTFTTHLTNIAHSDTELLTMNEGGILEPEHQGYPHYYMSKNVPLRGAAYGKKVVELLMPKIAKNMSEASDADIFMIHTGSKKILDVVCKVLHVKSQEQSNWSYKILEEYGNLSSCSIGFMIHHYVEDEKRRGVTHPPLWCLLVSFGVGFSASAGIIKF